MGHPATRETGVATLMPAASPRGDMLWLDATMRTVHLLFAAVWVGSVVYVTLGVLPLARDGDLNAAPIDRMAGTLTTVSRASSVVLLLTGGHMAGQGYTVGGGDGFSLFGSTQGHLVLTMVALWLVLTGLVEVGTSRLTDGTRQKKVREPARAALPLFRGASLVGLLLVVDAGLVTTGVLL